METNVIINTKSSFNFNKKIQVIEIAIITFDTSDLFLRVYLLGHVKIMKGIKIKLKC